MKLLYQIYNTTLNVFIFWKLSNNLHQTILLTNESFSSTMFKLYLVISLLMINTKHAFGSPNLRGSAISYELNNIYISKESIHRVSSRNLRGSTIHQDIVESKPTQGDGDGRKDNNVNGVYHLITNNNDSLHLHDYYNNEDQNEDLYSDVWLQKLNISRFSFPNQQEQINEIPNDMFGSSDSKINDSTATMPVNIRNLRLRGSAVRTHERQYPFAPKTSATCNCIMSEEECNAEGIACPLNIDPVCGCDNKTYFNSCEARYYGCNRSWRPGSCNGNLRATQK
jgi:hypothetical protein